MDRLQMTFDFCFLLTFLAADRTRPLGRHMNRGMSSSELSFVISPITRLSVRTHCFDFLLTHGATDLPGIALIGRQFRELPFDSIHRRLRIFTSQLSCRQSQAFPLLSFLRWTTDGSARLLRTSGRRWKSASSRKTRSRRRCASR